LKPGEDDIRKGLGGLAGALLVAVLLAMIQAGSLWADDNDHRHYGNDGKVAVSLGPRPFYLLSEMSPGPLKRELSQCEGPFKMHKFSIGHRGAPLQFPEHTRESYVAAARMGAGVNECDVTFTNDGRLVCRHSQSDLHTTTDIRLNPANADLAAKCGTSTGNPAVCSTSDLTLAEFKRLKGKMDAAGATHAFRTDPYVAGATLLSHRQSIRLFDRLGQDFTPELKSADMAFPFAGFNSQEEYAQALIDEYKEAGISPKRVWAQSFNLKDVLYWINQEPRFGRQAVYLDGRYSLVDGGGNPLISPTDPDDPGVDPRDGVTPMTLQDMRNIGVRVIAPPMWMLLKERDGKIVPSKYAGAAQRAGLKIISWTTERSGRIREDVIPAAGAFYYRSTLPALKNDGDILTTIDVLARKVGIIGLFSDWPATTTYYANCMLSKKGKQGKKDND
jgi:glycerophosphoryl diester phosphodiesterase